MKTFLIAFLLPLAAHASDLSRDRQVSHEPLSNPFNGVSELALADSDATELRLLLERCVIVPAAANVEEGARISSACAENLSMNADQNELQVRNLHLTIVSWDGSHSDGGDEQAVGVYDGAGARIAVYPSLFADGNVLDGLAHAVGARLPRVRR